MATRLVAISVVPLVILAVLAANNVDAARGYRERATRVSAESERLVQLVRLRMALTREATITTATLQSQAFRIPLAITSTWLGVDLEGELPAAQATTDSLAGLLDDDPAFAQARSQLGLARLTFAEGAADLGGLAKAYRSVSDASRKAPLEAVDRLRQLSAGVRDGDELRRRIEGLAVALNLMEALGDETQAIFDVVFQYGPAGDQARLALAVGAAKRSSALLLASELMGPTAADGRTMAISGAYAALMSSPDLATLEGSTSSFLSPGFTVPAAAPDAFTASARAASTFRSALVIEDLTLELVTAAGDDVVAASEDVQDRAEHDVRNVVGLALGSFMVALAGLAVLARSVGRPLAQLEARALAVVNGSADDEPLAPSGPREVRVAIQAHNELVANLVTIERQADALARGALDDPALAEPAAGSLGRSLQGTVNRLSDAIAAQTDLQSQLSYDATHDHLTGLVNRAAALDAVEAALGAAAASDALAAVLFIDLDGFKAVNDRHGHGVGDAVLRVAAERIVASARGGDVVARLGGDEFLVVSSPVTGLAEATAIGERIVAAVREPINLDGLAVQVGASVGVATATRPEDVDLVIHEADVAVYRAKALGRGRVEVAGEDDGARDGVGMVSPLGPR